VECVNHDLQEDMREQLALTYYLEQLKQLKNQFDPNNKWELYLAEL